MVLRFGWIWYDSVILKGKKQKLKAAFTQNQRIISWHRQSKVKLYKMGEFCCNIVANFVKGSVSGCVSGYPTASCLLVLTGKESPESLTNKLQIDQRTKVGVTQRKNIGSIVFFQLQNTGKKYWIVYDMIDQCILQLQTSTNIFFKNMYCKKILMLQFFRFF